MGKVLIIDDTKNIRTLLTTCLELRGYQVITAENGMRALEILNDKKDDISLIFLDIRMPGISGTEVLKNIRLMYVSCPVIIMTAFATVKNAIDCTKLGAVAYLQKPFSPDRVNAVLEELNKNYKRENQVDNNEDEVEKYIDTAKELIDKGDNEEAFKLLKLSLAIDPYIKEIYYLIAKVNENTNNSTRANQFYKIAKILD
ncbi:MAG: response regulator [Clostridiaceae bacterium]